MAQLPLQPATTSQTPLSVVTHRSPPFNDKDSLAQHSEKRNSPTPNPIQRFVAEVGRRLEQTEEHLSQVSHIRDQPKWKQDADPRVADLEISGSRNTSSVARFRRGLSQRSLAIEFDKWEQANYYTSKVKKRAIHSPVNPGRKLGHIKSFLESNDHRFQNCQAVRNGLQHGIKLLVCEKLLSGTGISAIFIFEYSRLRAIKYRELSGLKDAIKDADRIKKLADQKADWIDRCQKDYDEWYNSMKNCPPSLQTAITERLAPEDREKISSLSVIKSPSPLHHQSEQSQRPAFLSLQHSPNSLAIDTCDVAADATVHSADSDSGDTVPSQRIDHWRGNTNSRGQAMVDTSLIFDSTYNQSENLSFGPLQTAAPYSHTCHQVQSQNISFDSSMYTQGGKPSFNAVPQERAHALFHERVGAGPHLASCAEIARPQFLENSHLNGPSSHKTPEGFGVPEIYLSSGQETGPSLHPTHAEIMAPHFQENPYDGYSIYDSFPIQNSELSSTHEKAQETDPLLYPTSAEVMAPYFEVNSFDGHSIDLFSTQNFETSSTL